MPYANPFSTRIWRLKITPSSEDNLFGLFISMIILELTLINWNCTLLYFRLVISNFEFIQLCIPYWRENFEGFWSTLTILPKRSRLKRKLMKYPLGKIFPKSKPDNSPSNLLDGKYIEILDNPFKWQYSYDTTCSFKVLKTFRHVSLSKFLTSFNLLDGLKLARCLTWKRLGKTIRFEEWCSWLRGKNFLKIFILIWQLPFYKVYTLRATVFIRKMWRLRASL